MQDQSCRDACPDGDDGTPQPVGENTRGDHRQASQCSDFDKAESHSRNLSATQAFCQPAIGNVILASINASRWWQNQLTGLSGAHERELTKCRRSGSGSGEGFGDKRPRPIGDFDA